ncbi:Dyp-type peroxidase [Pseudomonas moorei]|jgi:putative iron-dependent peroxidase|uniref:Putative iron-dependent peroxidase n=1 Tax=Pseudomonas moorei TaxID=395599 RepID=A0A1H1FVX6_9PSED|nr:Dyp-type peroxidase [Pseudomonas moorei]KAB0509483.1 Dyp-type peroxidase [Pseudomonas moorei]PTU04765.1 peroxidase [Pseudomonas sp. HMWF031]SDR05134.1 putative iron-dependent peroxidase [Pseudomonas moorei]
MSHYQPGILATPVPPQARHMFFALESAAALPAALDNLMQLVDGQSAVVGFGESLVKALNGNIEGLRVFPALTGVGVDNPSTQHALWCWLHGVDRGELLNRSNALEAALAPALRLVQMTEGFRHRDGHDLTGYEDGTENPQDEAAAAAALVAEGVDGTVGGSFAAIQQWQHDLKGFHALPSHETDHIMGRRLSDNEELDDAPISAHVKRTAQESFAPEAFIVRRSMPWIEGDRAGLMFLAFGFSLDAFEVQLRRMSGLEDGITDGLYRISRPITGGYYWCPPLKDGRLDLRALRID